MKWMYRNTEEILEKYTDELYWIFFDIQNTDRYDVSDFKQTASDFLERFIRTFVVYFLSDQVDRLLED